MNITPETLNLPVPILASPSAAPEPVRIKKPYVRWSDADVEKIWAVFPEVMERNRKRGLTWQIERAGQMALGPDRWRKITSFTSIPSSLLKKIADRYPLLKHAYPQLETINQLPLDKELFISLITESRIGRPFDDIVDIWNECIALVPELSLPEVSHAKYIEPEMFGLIQKACETWLLPEPEPEPEPVPPPGPRLEEMKSLDLLVAYHAALLRELRAPPEQPEPKTPQAPEEPLNPPDPNPAPAPGPEETVTLADRLRARVKGLEVKSLSAIPALPGGLPSEADRLKVRVTVVDHNVSRTPDDFERTYKDNPHFRFKFTFMQIGATGTPMFKTGGYAILSESAPVAWKTEAIRVCGKANVYVSNGSREQTHESMRKLISSLETARTRNGPSKN